jgi:DNA-binding response OmpR family regulator
MSMPRILLVDDQETVLFSLGRILEYNKFLVSVASTVPKALKLISTEEFDVLLSDLHMPGAGDGLTLVSAMRHANPKAVTLLLSGFPDVEAGAQAIVRQTDHIMVKPIDVNTLVQVIHERLDNPMAHSHPAVESVAVVVERCTQAIIDTWFKKVQLDHDLTDIPMPEEQRCRHLPMLFEELVGRLRSSKPLGGKDGSLEYAAKHGVIRRKQGYSAAMMVEESRMLQVSIFQTLQENLSSMDYSTMLLGVMTIADEVDAQLGEAMIGYGFEALADDLQP